MRIAGYQRGFGVVEILIALTLGLILLSGVVQIYLSSKQSYRANESLARIQEGGRFSVDVLARELRVAGYRGSCGRDIPINNLLDPDGTGYSADLYDLNDAIQGWNGSRPSASYADAMSGYRAGTDVLLLKHAAAASDAAATGVTPANANTINLDRESGLPKGTIVVVSDAQGCDIFQKNDNANAHSLTRGAGVEPGNLDPASHDFSHAYDETMEISTLRSALYYVGSGAGGLPALRRTLFDWGNNPVDQELVTGILDMQVTYGEDTDGDGALNAPYVTANAVAQWTNVVAVRICVVGISAASNILPDPLTVPCNGVDVAIPDNRSAQVFTTTIALRNRLP